MMPATLAQACQPRQSVFDPSIRDTVYNIDDLNQIDPKAFFAENYVTQGMRQLLGETFKRLEGKSPNASGAFLLSQSMGGGKTHNLIALGLLARHPELRKPVMESFYTPGSVGAVRVVTFSGRKTHTPFGIWGEIAQQLGRSEAFKDFYSPLKPPGDQEWVTLLQGEPVLILLDELPPYFEAAQAVPVGMTSLDRITTTALANLLVAVSSGKLPNACIVLTDLRASAYGAGSASMSDALRNLEMETRRAVVHIDPVRLASDELYHILRTRLFANLPEPAEIDGVADAYAQAVDEARRMDQTTASAQTMRSEIRNAYPFHPGIRDLYARFKENPGFQQTRALIRLMRVVVSNMWERGAAQQKYLIGAHDLDFHHSEVMSEIRQINSALEAAIAHDVANETGTAVAEQIDAGTATDAQDSAKLIFLSSLSQAVNPTLGLTRSEIVQYLAAPHRDVTRLRSAIDNLQSQAWYLHATAQGALLFKNVENLNAKQESYASGMLNEQRETELRDRLKEMFAAKTGGCYQDVQALPALDQVQPTQDRVTLIIFRPSNLAKQEIEEFYSHQQFKNRVLFLTGDLASYVRVLERSAYLRAIRLIIQEFQRQGMREDDPQFVDANGIQTRDESQFYLACRETFQRLYYPSKDRLTELAVDLQYVANKYEGEQQIVAALEGAFKYEKDTSPDSASFRTRLENRLWPEGSKEVAWSEIKRRAASDPSWVWHHPRALDELKDELIRRDIWRDLGGGFVQRGPFPKPTTSVSIQQLSRDPNTGEVRLRIKPLHGDQVYVSDQSSLGVAEKLEEYEYTTTDLKLSFWSVDSANDHETGDKIIWQNTIEVKYRFYDQGGRLMCELQALPSGDIRYTNDGSSPATSGVAYTQPFAVPATTRFVLAQASAEGVTSATVQAQVPADGSVGRPTVDPRRPAKWKRRISRDSTGDTYTFLEMAAKHRAQLGGVSLTVAKEKSWVQLTTDGETYQDVASVREQTAVLVKVVAGGSVTLEADALKFESGQDLQDMVTDMKTTLESGEVEQGS